MGSCQLVVLLALAGGCSHRTNVSSCESDLHGVWLAPAGVRWMILDQGPASLEVYPLFADGAGSGDMIAAPRVIDLHREGTGLQGEVSRRYMRRADACEARAPALVTSCASDTLEVVIAEVAAPVSFAPCRWQPPAPSRVESWHRE